MNPDPDSSPARDVEARRLARVERRRTWRVYALFLTGLYALTYAHACTTDFRAVLIPEVFFSAVGLTGLFAFAFRKPVLRAPLWAVWAVLLPVWDVLFGFVFYRPPKDTGGVVAAVMSLLFVVPEYVALWRYGRSSSDIWQTAARQKS